MSKLLHTRKEKIIVAVIVTLILLIPSGSFLLAQRFRASDKSSLDTLNQKTITNPKENKNPNSLTGLKNNSESDPLLDDKVPELSYGPTLSFAVELEGRPKTNQATKMFVGIAQGKPQDSPTYLLSFNVDIPADGKYSGLSLAGLNQNQTYTAYFKSAAQIATASAFVAKPTSSDLGLLKLLTGDLNEDNVINNTDYAVAKTATGTTPKSKNWNSLADFNLDSKINNLDLAIISRNLGKIGASGPWFSKTSSESASLKTEPSNLGGPSTPATPTGVMKIPGEGGYWLWVPE